MKSDVTYDLLIIGGGISGCVFASKYLKNNITKKVGLIEIGRGLGGRSSTRISKKYKGWKLNHGSPNFNISNTKNNLLLKRYIDELLENKFIKIDDSEIFFLNEDSNLETKKKSEFSCGVNYLSLDSMSELSKNIIESNNLKDKWELILSKLELPSTRMLLSQQAELESFDSEKITIALSPNWESMIKSRKVIIENTVKKIFGDGIILNFSTKQLNKSNPTNTPEITQNEVNNLRPIKKLEPKTNSSTKISNEENYDDSSKNLANFFNGEIIDLDE